MRRLLYISLLWVGILWTMRGSTQNFSRPGVEFPTLSTTFLPGTAADSIFAARLIDSGKRLEFTDLERAAEILQQAYRFSAERGWDSVAAQSLIVMSGVYSFYNENAKAGWALEKAWEHIIYEKATNFDLRIRWLNNRSIVYLRTGAWDKAYRCLDLALSYAKMKTPPDSGLTALVYLNIANIWNVANEPSKSLYYLEKCFRIEEATRLPDYVRIYMNDLTGIQYDKQGQFDTAGIYYREALRLSERSGNVRARHLALSSLGNLYRRKGNYDSATFFLNRVISDRIIADPVSSRIWPHYYLSNISEAKGDLHNAIRHIRQAEKHLKPFMGHIIHATVLRQAASLHAKINDHETSLVYYERYVEAKDSLLNEEKQKSISELDVKYKTAETEKELAQQKMLLTAKEYKLKEKNLIIGFTTGAVLVLALAAWLTYRNYRRSQEEKIKNLIKDREIEKLHSVMEGEEKERSRIAHELHDGIVSQLTAVKYIFSNLLEQEEPDKSSFRKGFHYLDETMRDLRKTAHNLMPESVVNNGLTYAVQEFCIKSDNPEKTRVHFMHTGEPPVIPHMIALSIYRMVQELVQNGLKHAQAENIIVQLDYDAGQLHLTVEDDGKGLPEGRELADDSGTGLSYIRQKIGIMHGQVSISSSDRGFALYAHIPLQPMSAEDVQQLQYT